MQSVYLRAASPLLIAIFIVAAILVLNVPILNSGLKNGFYSLLAPVQRNVWVAGARFYDFFGSISNINAAGEENRKLKEQVNDLIVQKAQAEDIERENVFLRRGLELEIAKDFDLNLADIVAKNMANDSIIINKGAEDKVEVGMPVITSGKAVAGRVLKVYGGFSQVQLITSKDFSFDVKIGDEMVDGLVKGKGGSDAGIDLVPKDKELAAGAAVVTSRMGGIFPAGLLIGVVKDVNKNDPGMFQSAQISLSFDIRGAEYVFVVNEKFPAGMGILPPDQNKK